MRSDRSRAEWMKFIPRGSRLTQVVNFQHKKSTTYVAISHAQNG